MLMFASVRRSSNCAALLTAFLNVHVVVPNVTFFGAHAAVVYKSKAKATAPGTPSSAAGAGAAGEVGADAAPGTVGTQRQAGGDDRPLRFGSVDIRDGDPESTQAERGGAALRPPPRYQSSSSTEDAKVLKINGNGRRRSRYEWHQLPPGDSESPPPFAEFREVDETAPLPWLAAAFPQKIFDFEKNAPGLQREEDQQAPQPPHPHPATPATSSFGASGAGAAGGPSAASRVRQQWQHRRRPQEIEVPSTPNSSANVSPNDPVYLNAQLPRPGTPYHPQQGGYQLHLQELPAVEGPQPPQHPLPQQPQHPLPQQPQHPLPQQPQHPLPQQPHQPHQPPAQFLHIPVPPISIPVPVDVGGTAPPHQQNTPPSDMRCVLVQRTYRVQVDAKTAAAMVGSGTAQLQQPIGGYVPVGPFASPQFAWGADGGGVPVPAAPPLGFPSAFAAAQAIAVPIMPMRLMCAGPTTSSPAPPAGNPYPASPAPPAAPYQPSFLFPTQCLPSSGGAADTSGPKGANVPESPPMAAASIFGEQRAGQQDPSGVDEAATCRSCAAPDISPASPTASTASPTAKPLLGRMKQSERDKIRAQLEDHRRWFYEECQGKSPHPWHPSSLSLAEHIRWLHQQQGAHEDPPVSEIDRTASSSLEERPTAERANAQLHSSISSGAQAAGDAQVSVAMEHRSQRDEPALPGHPDHDDAAKRETTGEPGRGESSAEVGHVDGEKLKKCSCEDNAWSVLEDNACEDNAWLVEAAPLLEGTAQQLYLCDEQQVRRGTSHPMPLEVQQAAAAGGDVVEAPGHISDKAPKHEEEHLRPPTLPLQTSCGVQLPEEVDDELQGDEIVDDRPEQPPQEPALPPVETCDAVVAQSTPPCCNDDSAVYQSWVDQLPKGKKGDEAQRRAAAVNKANAGAGIYTKKNLLGKGVAGTTIKTPYAAAGRVDKKNKKRTQQAEATPEEQTDHVTVSRATTSVGRRGDPKHAGDAVEEVPEAGSEAPNTASPSDDVSTDDGTTKEGSAEVEALIAGTTGHMKMTVPQLRRYLDLLQRTFVAVRSGQALVYAAYMQSPGPRMSFLAERSEGILVRRFLPFFFAEYANPSSSKYWRMLAGIKNFAEKLAVRFPFKVKQGEGSESVANKGHQKKSETQEQQENEFFPEDVLIFLDRIYAARDADLNGWFCQRLSEDGGLVRMLTRALYAVYGELAVADDHRSAGPAAAEDTTTSLLAWARKNFGTQFVIEWQPPREQKAGVGTGTEWVAGNAFMSGTRVEHGVVHVGARNATGGSATTAAVELLLQSRYEELGLPTAVIIAEMVRGVDDVWNHTVLQLQLEALSKSLKIRAGKKKGYRWKEQEEALKYAETLFSDELRRNWAAVAQNNYGRAIVAGKEVSRWLAFPVGGGASSNPTAAAGAAFLALLTLRNPPAEAEQPDQVAVQAVVRIGVGESKGAMCTSIPPEKATDREVVIANTLLRKAHLVVPSARAVKVSLPKNEDERQYLFEIKEKTIEGRLAKIALELWPLDEGHSVKNSAGNASDSARARPSASSPEFRERGSQRDESILSAAEMEAVLEELPVLLVPVPPSTTTTTKESCPPAQHEAAVVNSSASKSKSESESPPGPEHERLEQKVDGAVSISKSCARDGPPEQPGAGELPQREQDERPPPPPKAVYATVARCTGCNASYFLPRHATSRYCLLRKWHETATTERQHVQPIAQQVCFCGLPFLCPNGLARGDIHYLQCGSSCCTAAEPRWKNELDDYVYELNYKASQRSTSASAGAAGASCTNGLCKEAKQANLNVQSNIQKSSQVWVPKFGLRWLLDTMMEADVEGTKAGLYTVNPEKPADPPGPYSLDWGALLLVLRHSNKFEWKQRDDENAVIHEKPPPKSIAKAQQLLENTLGLVYADLLMGYCEIAFDSHTLPPPVAANRTGSSAAPTSSCGSGAGGGDRVAVPIPSGLTALQMRRGEVTNNYQLHIELRDLEMQREAEERRRVQLRQEKQQSGDPIASAAVELADAIEHAVDLQLFQPNRQNRRAVPATKRAPLQRQSAGGRDAYLLTLPVECRKPGEGLKAVSVKIDHDGREWLKRVMRRPGDIHIKQAEGEALFPWRNKVFSLRDFLNARRKALLEFQQNTFASQKALSDRYEANLKWEEEMRKRNKARVGLQKVEEEERAAGAGAATTAMEVESADRPETQTEGGRAVETHQTESEGEAHAEGHRAADEDPRAGTDLHAGDRKVAKGGADWDRVVARGGVGDPIMLDEKDACRRLRGNDTNVVADAEQAAANENAARAAKRAEVERQVALALAARKKQEAQEDEAPAIAANAKENNYQVQPHLVEQEPPKWTTRDWTTKEAQANANGQHWKNASESVELTHAQREQ